MAIFCFRVLIFATFALVPLIHRDFTFALTSLWVGWTFARVKPWNKDLQTGQLSWILFCSVVGFLIGHYWAYFK